MNNRFPGSKNTSKRSGFNLILISLFRDSQFGWFLFVCIFLLFPVKKWPPREQLPLIRKGEDYACSPFRSPTQKQHQKPHLLICNIFLHFLGRAMLCLKMCHHTTEDTEFLFHNTQNPKCSVDVNSSYPPTRRERCFPRFSRLHGSLSEQTQSWVESLATFSANVSTGTVIWLK